MIIDTHEHIASDHPSMLAVLARHEIFVTNICVSHDLGDEWRDNAAEYARLAKAHPGRFGWITTFSLPTPDELGDAAAGRRYAAREVDSIRRDVAAGAVACKVWKNVGMGIKDGHGSYVLVDHPIFEPIFAALEADGTTLVAHIAEPLACWQPLDPKSPHYGYYSTHLEWHVHTRQQQGDSIPSHQAQIDALDRVIAAHPKLTVVGAHLGSQEHDVALVAKRMARFPRFSVDISARLGDLVTQDQGAVRAFFLAHHDRILFGTDVVYDQRTTKSEEERIAATAKTDREIGRYRSYLEGSETVEAAGRRVAGLDLPADVVADVMVRNAGRIFSKLARVAQ